MGNSDHQVALERRRQLVVEQWNLEHEVVLVRSGQALSIAGSDLHHVPV